MFKDRKLPIILIILILLMIPSAFLLISREQKKATIETNIPGAADKVEAVTMAPDVDEANEGKDEIESDNRNADMNKDETESDNRDADMNKDETESDNRDTDVNKDETEPDGSEADMNKLGTRQESREDIRTDNEERKAVAEWKQAYFAVAAQLEMAPWDTTGWVLLRDINFDKIPEMFFTSSSTRTYYLKGGFSYQNGKMVEIPITTLIGEVDFMERYQNKETGEAFWMAEGGVAFMPAPSRSWRAEAVWNKIIFSEDLSIVEEIPVLRWEVFEFDDEREDEYYLIDPSEERQPVTDEEIEQLKRALFSDNEHVPTLLVYSQYS